MQLFAAKDIWCEACAALEGRKDNGESCPVDLARAELLFHEILNNNIGHPTALTGLGGYFLKRGQFGAAIMMLSQATQIRPDIAEAWNNLGLAWRFVGQWERAAKCMDKAAKLCANEDMAINYSGSYLNQNMPEKSVELCDRFLAQYPDSVKIKFHKALGLLEMRKWGEAWDLHETRLEGGGNEEAQAAIRNYHGEGNMTPWWDGKAKGRVVIHGEQGMGDEIMFASCIPDAIATGAEIIIECSPRLHKAFARSFPGAKVFGTNNVDGKEWIDKWGVPDFKCALGSLPKFFRRSAEAFPGKPFLLADPTLRAWWGEKLAALGRRPNVGLAWQGGVQWTRFDARSFHPSMFGPILQHDCNFVSLQYDVTAQACVKDIREQMGVKIHHWPKAVEAKNPETGKQNDLDDLIALISKLDLVISVCQTAIHVAGALGVPTLCLTPSEPSWRYGAGEATDMPWYGSVELVRQRNGSKDWAPVIERANHALETFLQVRERVNVDFG